MPGVTDNNNKNNNNNNNSASGLTHLDGLSPGGVSSQQPLFLSSSTDEFGLLSSSNYHSTSVQRTIQVNQPPPPPHTNTQTHTLHPVLDTPPNCYTSSLTYPLPLSLWQVILRNPQDVYRTSNMHTL